MGSKSILGSLMAYGLVKHTGWEFIAGHNIHTHPAGFCKIGGTGDPGEKPTYALQTQDKIRDP